MSGRRQRRRRRRRRRNGGGGAGRVVRDNGIFDLGGGDHELGLGDVALRESVLELSEGEGWGWARRWRCGRIQCVEETCPVVADRGGEG